MNSSISRRLVFWLAVPLTLLALCGVLVHYFNNLAPQVMSADHRLKAESAALAERLQNGTAQDRPIEPADPSIRYALRDANQNLLAGDARLPALQVGETAGPVYAT